MIPDSFDLSPKGLSLLGHGLQFGLPAHAQGGPDQHGQGCHHPRGPGDRGRPAERKHDRRNERDHRCDARSVDYERTPCFAGRRGDDPGRNEQHAQHVGADRRNPVRGRTEDKRRDEDKNAEHHRGVVLPPLPSRHDPMPPATSIVSCATYDTNRMSEPFVPVRIEVMTLGEAWMSIAAAILAGGAVGNWEGLPIVEVFRATLDVSSPRMDDPIIASTAILHAWPGCTRTLPTTPGWQISVTPTATRRACTTTPIPAATRSAG